jgi:solute carrier family 25 protein 38
MNSAKNPDSKNSTRTAWNSMFDGAFSGCLSGMLL